MPLPSKDDVKRKFPWSATLSPEVLGDQFVGHKVFVRRRDRLPLIGPAVHLLLTSLSQRLEPLSKSLFVVPYQRVWLFLFRQLQDTKDP